MDIEEWKIDYECYECHKNNEIDLVYDIIDDLTTNEIRELRDYLDGQLELYGGLT